MVTKVFAQQGLLVSAPVDLPEYNLLDDADWKRLLAVIRKERPLLLAAGFPCTSWSSLQYLSRHLPGRERTLQRQRKLDTALLERTRALHFFKSSATASQCLKTPWVVKLGSNRLSKA